MSSLEEIAALLGFVAFVGLAVLVFLTFQQGRHLRRLRDWAGREPERAALLAARGEQPDEDPAAAEISDEELDQVHVVEPGRMAILAAGMRERWAEFDRRSPVEPKLLVGGIAAIALGVGIATGGFGLFGGADAPTEQSSSGKAGKSAGQGDRAEGNQGEKSKQTTEVAVLNGTAPPGGTGVAGVADRLTADVEGAGFEVATVDNAGSFVTSTVMWTGSSEAETQAQELADALSPVLGTTTVVEMSPEIETLAGGATIALIVGQDDATI